MNKNTYVRDILKSIGARSGMKLYTSPYGVCTFQNIGLDRINLCYEHDRVGTFFSVSLKGRMSEGGELVLFPSKNMRDWSKFGWNKGDVIRARSASSRNGTMMTTQSLMASLSQTDSMTRCLIPRIGSRRVMRMPSWRISVILRRPKVDN